MADTTELAQSASALLRRCRTALDGMRSRAGLANVGKPTGSFLLAGPTGVGKTEMAKQLAAVLGINFVRFDMEKHAVARLIGSPPGYVGFEQGGLLTDAIRKNPYSVLLLDEIEKAHPDMRSSDHCPENAFLRVRCMSCSIPSTPRVVCSRSTPPGGRPWATPLRNWSANR